MVLTIGGFFVKNRHIMKKAHKTIITFLIFWMCVISALFWFAQIKQNQMMFYYGDTCPHCKIVEQYMSENNIYSNYKVVMKEVYNDEKNKNELIRKAGLCNLSANNIGLPFLIYKKKCYVGDVDMIKFFEGLKK